MLPIHNSNAKTLSIKFHRENVRRYYHTSIGQEFTVEGILSDMGLNKDNVGMDSLDWITKWTKKNSGSTFASVPCLERITYGDWTIEFLCDISFS